ncbi:MAG: hypothetical protein RR293_03070 [Bacteroidales bacterium]
MYDSRIIRIPTDAASHLVCITAAIVMIAIAVFLKSPEVAPYNGIIQIPSVSEWLSSPIAIIINTVAIISLVLLISTITNRFGLTSSYSVLPTMFFLILQCSNPMTGGLLQIGTIAAIAIMLCTNTLFENYQKPRIERSVFMMTLLLATVSLFWYEFLLYIPIMWIGLAQMHTLKIKTLFASLIAIATIAWIYTGAVYIDLLPTPINPFHGTEFNINIPDYANLPSTTIFTIISTIPAITILFVLKLSTLYSEMQDKISVRNYNMYINTVAFLTFIFMIINPSQILNFLPIFNCVAAIEAARYFNTIRTKSKLRFLYFITAIYLVLYIIWIL